MKLSKTMLKALIKECIVELYDDDPRLMRALVKESLVELTAKSKKRPKRDRRPRGTNVPALQRNSRQPSRGREFEDEGPASLWEALASDTLNTTFQSQPMGNGNTPQTGMTNWATINSLPADDGPAAHLARSQQMQHMQMMQNQQNPAMLHAQQQMHIRQMQAAAQHAAQHGQHATALPGQAAPQRPMPQMAPPTPAAFNQGFEPSQAQLTQQFQNMKPEASPFPQHAAFSAGGGNQQEALPAVPDDLAMLGIGDMSAHLDAPARGGSMDMNAQLAALAADMNAGL